MFQEQFHSNLQGFCALFAGTDKVNDYAEDKRASNRCKGNFTESKGKSADTRDEYNSRGEEVAVFVEVYRLEQAKELRAAIGERMRKA